jgi:hypothetical protein
MRAVLANPLCVSYIQGNSMHAHTEAASARDTPVSSLPASHLAVKRHTQSGTLAVKRHTYLHFDCAVTVCARMLVPCLVQALLLLCWHFAVSLALSCLSSTSRVNAERLSRGTRILVCTDDFLRTLKQLSRGRHRGDSTLQNKTSTYRVSNLKVLAQCFVGNLCKSMP